jgi:hypothetical protein
VSRRVAYDAPALLERLKSLIKPNGLIYLTLLGDEGEWAAGPGAKAMTFDHAMALFAQANLRPLYRSAEWFDGYVYSGAGKFWHQYKFVRSLTKER